jgi:hypothetical protein
VESHFKGHLELAGRVIPFTTENLSLKGMLCHLESDAPLEVDLPCRAVVPLASDIIIRVDAVVARQEGNEAAVDFTGMDEESYTHLRNVVRYAAGDADRIDEEQVVPAFGDKDEPAED